MDVNCYDVEGNTPLYYAALNGNTAFCAFLLTNGADVNLPSKHGNIPLHAAFVSNNVVLITLLIQNNANLNEINH
jgi:ankyrin repeat protein